MRAPGIPGMPYVCLDNDSQISKSVNYSGGQTSPRPLQHPRGVTLSLRCGKFGKFGPFPKKNQGGHGDLPHAGETNPRIRRFPPQIGLAALKWVKNRVKKGLKIPSRPPGMADLQPFPPQTGPAALKWVKKGLKIPS